jgi:hypothetical protein
MRVLHTGTVEPDRRISAEIEFGEIEVVLSGQD